MTQTGARVLDYGLHDRAAGPFLVAASSGSTSSTGGSAGGASGRSILLRPYGPLFALHQDGEHLFTCSSNGSIVYKVSVIPYYTIKFSPLRRTFDIEHIHTNIHPHPFKIK